MLNFINQTHFERLVMILRAAGFVSSRLISGQNAVNFAYILYLRGRAEKMPADDIERLVRRWFVMSLLTGRYSGTPETPFDSDIRQIEANGLAAHTSAFSEVQLTNDFFPALLPGPAIRLMGVSSYDSRGNTRCGHILAFLLQ